MLQLALLLPGGPCRKAGQGVGKSVFFYRRELEAERIGLESYVTAAGVGDRLITAEEMNIRYLTLADDSRDARLEWLHRVVGEFRCEAWSDKATAFMSNHTGHYDALIVGGKDAARIVRILRDNFPLLQTKMKICLTAGSSARARAQLIAAGFDDAIDVARIEPVEGVARLRAIWRRYVEWYGRQESERLYLARLAQIVDLDGLSEREKKLIACLELTPGRPVRCRAAIQRFCNRFQILFIKSIAFYHRIYRIINKIPPFQGYVFAKTAILLILMDLWNSQSR